ncbi:MAG TPA: response regulator [Chloroflexota bacterium]
MQGVKELVLVVDDDKLTLSLMTEILGEAGYQVETASGGRQAMEQVNRRVPDVVLLDLAMPRMDGYSLAQELRRQVSKKLLILALTGRPSSDWPRAEKAGFDGWIQKPFEVSELLASLGRYTAQAS